MTNEVPYELVRHICEALDFAPENVRQITFRARERSVEVLFYALDEEGAKHLGARGVVLEAVTFPIERVIRDYES